jgi:hypothetical protein
MAMGIFTGGGVHEAMSDFSLALFSTDTSVVGAATAAGVEMIVVDWEFRGKSARQAGADTEINSDTAEDLRRVRAATAATVVCRVNQSGDWTAEEVDLAIDCGADEILLPMVRTAAEVEHLLRIVDGRCKAGILIETLDAAACAADIATLPLSRVYFGLHDFAIDCRSSNIFLPMIDGTIERTRAHFDVPFGFGGLTLPDRGAPIPSTLLLGEMIRLGCSFSFLRRSFHRDLVSTTMADGIARIRSAVRDARARSAAAIERDRRALEMHVRAWPERETAAAGSSQS